MKNRTLQKLSSQNSARIGIAIAGLLLFLALVVPFVSPFEPDKTNPAEKLAAPNFEHLLGTDQYGRDVLARIADGARRSLGAAVLVLSGTLVLSLIIGIAVGTIGVNVMVAMGMASISIQTASLARVIVGGALFGAGLAVFGLCPGTSVAACGEGRR